MSDFKLKLTIGEFSKLCYVTVKTLRHYERIGLLRPHEVDKWTGYRYYDVSQMSDMVKIKNFKELGLQLEDIKEIFEEKQFELDKELVERKISETEGDLCRLRHRLLALQKLREQTVKTKIMSKIVIKPLPSGIVASFRHHLKGYDELGPLCTNVIGPEMQRLGCQCPEETAYCFTVDYNRHHNPSDIDLEYCEIISESCKDSELIKFRELPIVETAVCIEHHGGYENFNESVAAVFDFIEHHPWEISGEPRFSYIHGIWDCDSVSDWLTEVQVPVRKVEKTNC